MITLEVTFHGSIYIKYLHEILKKLGLKDPYQ